MLLTIIITVTVSWLTFGIMTMYNKYNQSNHENARLKRENNDKSDRLRALDADATEQRVKNAYNQGLYDGRRTDELYRQIVNRYSNGDKVTIMMHGEKAN